MKEGVKNIETLSLFYTAGVVLGTLFLSGTGLFLPAVLLPVLALPFFFQRRMIRWKEEVSIPLILLTFLMLGIFCARTAAIPAVQEITPLEALAAGAAARLRALIDAIPFQADTTAPLLKAFLTGDRSALTSATIAVFRSSGASHLLALSGLHMGILYLLFDGATRPFGHSPAARVVRYVLLMAGAGFFVLLTGAGPSVVRAFLFISINELLRLLNRPQKPTRVFCVALLIQLVWNPAVVSSVGFQLSYLAMAGIFLVYPTLERWYPEGSRYNPFRWMWKASALSISCQLFTAPLAWLRFHSFPRYFLLTNLTALPLTSVFMTVSVLTLALGAAGLYPQLLITATDGLGRLLLWMLEIISSM